MLGGRVRLLQPRGGFRSAIDPILLAAAIPALPGQRALELGCGSGAAALALAARLTEIQVHGLDSAGDLIDLANRSAGLNNMGGRVSFSAGDVLRAINGGPFDHVMANPPYLKFDHGHPPADPARRRAVVEGTATLADWVRAAMAAAGDGGSVTFVHRHDRADELVDLLADGGGDIRLLPLWPKQPGDGAKRVIVQAWKGRDGATRRLDGLILHRADGAYTAAAEAVLRDAAALGL